MHVMQILSLTFLSEVNTICSANIQWYKYAERSFPARYKVQVSSCAQDMALWVMHPIWILVQRLRQATSNF